MNTEVTAESIIEYWFSDTIKPQWFKASKELDKEIKEKYQRNWKSAIRGEYKHWKESAIGSLALVIIFDQFPLNMFRGEIESFSTEAMAVKITKHAIDNGFDKELEKHQLAFLYMPLMHSENINDQDLAVTLFEEAGLKENLRFAKHHRDIVKQFGRFPHRNKILQRESSQQELDYLNSDNAFTG